jgi:hypothetical protein
MSSQASKQRDEDAQSADIPDVVTEWLDACAVHSTLRVREHAQRSGCPFVPLRPVPVACPSSRVLVVTRGHWR